MAVWRRTFNPRTFSGYSLIEVLVAMALLAFGLLAVVLNNTQVLKTKVDTQVHSLAMQVTAKHIEPLSLSVAQGNSQFLSTLNAIPSSNTRPEFEISVKKSIDAAGKDLNIYPIDEWTPPYEVVLNVAYKPKGTTTLNFPSTHVFVPTP